MRKGSLKYLSVIFLILISLTSCVPQLVVSELHHKTHAVLKENQPNCTEYINALEDAENDLKIDRCLDTVWCYRSLWKYWENEYQILDTQLESMNKE